MENFLFYKVMKITECITDIVLINIMWFLGCALGGVILGWAPSTVAVLNIIRNKIKKEGYYGVTKSFWTTYKKEFKKSNVLGITIILFLAIASINEMNFKTQPEFIFEALTTTSVLAKAVIWGIILYMFPLYVHYDMNLKSYFIKALGLIIKRPLVTICIALWTILVYFTIKMVPGIIVIFGVSIYLYGVMAINYQFFMRNEQRLRANTN